MGGALRRRALLGGGQFVDGRPGVEPPAGTPAAAHREGLQSFTLLVIDPAAFGDPGLYAGKVEGMLDWVRELHPRPRL